MAPNGVQAPDLELERLLHHFLQRPAPAAAGERAAGAPLGIRVACAGRAGRGRGAGRPRAGAGVLRKEQLAVVGGDAVALVDAREQALRVGQQRRGAQALCLAPRTRRRWAMGVRVEDRVGDSGAAPGTPAGLRLGPCRVCDHAYFGTQSLGRCAALSGSVSSEGGCKKGSQSLHLLSCRICAVVASGTC